MDTKKNHQISLKTAVEMIKRFRANKPGGFAYSETFEKEAVQKLLTTKGCVSLRIYYGMKEDKEAHAILVAVDSNGRSILPKADSQTALTIGDVDDEPVILEDAFRCPPVCFDDPPLNED